MFNFNPAPHHRLEIHLLKVQPVAGFNSSDASCPQELFYGGKRRLRFSSQSIKAAIRKSNSSQTDQGAKNQGRHLIPQRQRFGRAMSSDRFFAPFNEALQVAHAFTTHEVPTERDGWIASNDADSRVVSQQINASTEDEIEKTASRCRERPMVETRCFGSGIFYHYYCIDLDLLFDNLRRAYPELEADWIAEASAQLTANFTLDTIGANRQEDQSTLISGAAAEVVVAGISTGFPNSAAAAFEAGVEPSDGVLNASIVQLEAWLNEKKVKQGRWVDSVKTVGFASDQLTMPALVSQLTSETQQICIRRAA